MISKTLGRLSLTASWTAFSPLLFYAKGFAYRSMSFSIASMLFIITAYFRTSIPFGGWFHDSPGRYCWRLLLVLTKGDPEYEGSLQLSLTGVSFCRLSCRMFANWQELKPTAYQAFRSCHAWSLWQWPRSYCNLQIYQSDSKIRLSSARISINDMIRQLSASMFETMGISEILKRPEKSYDYEKKSICTLPIPLQHHPHFYGTFRTPSQTIAIKDYWKPMLAPFCK